MAGLYPLMLKLDNRRALVVGAGEIAVSKAKSLLDAGARVRLVSGGGALPARDDNLECHLRPFRASDLDGCWLVVCAASTAVNREVARLAEARRIFTVCVDDPSHCSAYGAAVVRRANVTVAISTDGTAPALAALLREAVDELLPKDVVDWVTVAKALRQVWRRDRVRMTDRRPRLLRALNELYATRLRRVSRWDAP